MNSLSYAIGLNIGAEALNGGNPPPKLVICICLHCYHRADPTNEHPVHRVPRSIAAECAWCIGSDEEDMRFVALPPETIKRGARLASEPAGIGAGRRGKAMKYTHVVTVEAWLAGGVAAGAFERAKAVSARRQIFDLEAETSFTCRICGERQGDCCADCLEKDPQNAVKPMEIRPSCHKNDAPSSDRDGVIKPGSVSVPPGGTDP